MATSPSPSNLGKKPKWHLTDEELLRLPSRICGMAADTELKCRREAACFIQDMADWLNHNVQNRGRIDQNCICIAMLHMHRFYLVHSFTVFPPKDVAAASLFLAGKSEESPRKLEHIVEVWFKLKYKGADVQPPFNDTVKKNGAELIVYLESILLQTIGFELHVQLPHPVVINKMQKFKLEGISEDQKLVELAYWFATDIIQYTNWCIRFNEKAIACVCIYLAYIWAGHEIPETAGAPWFKSIDPEMTEELLIKLTEEFTLIYTNCNYCHAYKFIEKVKKNGNPATMPAKVIAQLPPPPPPPVMGQMQPVKSEPPSVDQQKRPAPAAARPAPVAADGTLPRPLKRSPKSEPCDNNSSNMVASKRPAMATANPNSRADGLSSEKNATTAVNCQQPNDQIRMPLPPVKLEPISSPVSSTATPKSLASDEPPGVAVTINKKKIGLSEYKQRLNKIKSEPAASDSPASQATPTNSQSIQSTCEIKLEMNCGGADNNNGTPSAAAATTDGAEKKDKRQSFMPDLSNASSSTLGATALELPIGIPLVEKTKKPQRHDSIDREKQLQHAAMAMATAHRSAEDHKRTNNNNSSSASSTHRSHHHREHHHNSSGSERSHSQHEHHKQHHKSHHRDKERDSTRIYLNGSISSSSSSAEKPHHKSSSRERERRAEGAIMVTGNASSAEEQHRHRLLLQQKLKSEKRLTPPPPPPPPPPVNRLSPTNGQPPPPPPAAAAADGNGHQQQQHQELEEGELL